MENTKYSEDYSEDEVSLKVESTDYIEGFQEEESLEIEKKLNEEIEDFEETMNTLEIEESIKVEETLITNKIFECDKACLTCTKSFENNNTNCIKCNSKNGYYPIFGEDNSNCFSNETIKTGYYLNTKNDSFTWNKCYEKCKTCNSEGNATNMNCLSCKTYLNEEFINQKIFFKITDSGNCIEACQKNTFMTSNGYCVSTCPNNTYKFFLNYSCINSCPNGYIIDETKNECILKSIEKASSTQEFKNLILSNISNFVNSSKIINGSNFLAVVLSSDKMKPEDQIKMGISAVDLCNCTEVLKEHYNISKNENLIILNMETKNEEATKNETNPDENKSFNLGKKMHLEVYDFSGRKLDLSVCKEDIKVMKYIGDTVEELNIQSAMDLADKGIDVFNTQDKFFNDICHPFNNSDGKDIILTDRRNDLYQNATFCEDGCTYTGMNYDLMVANCICDSSILQKEEQNITNEEEKQISEKVNFNTITKSFIQSLIDFNYEVIFCYNLVFDIKILVKNIGFYSLFGMFILQMVFLFIYLIKKLKSIRYFMLIFNTDKKTNNRTKNNNDINNNNKITHINNNKNSKIIKNKDKASPPKNNQNSIQTSLDHNQKSISNINSKNKNKKRKIRMNMKNNESLISKTSDQNNQSNSKKKIISENDSNNIENILEKDIQTKNLNLQKSNELKKIPKEHYIISHNFAPTINIQTSLLNINNKDKKIPISSKKTNLIEGSESKEIFPKNQIKEIILDNNEIHENNDKIYNIKSNRKRPLKRTLMNKKGEANQKSIQYMETVAGKSTTKIKKEDIVKLSNSDSDLQDMDYEEAIIYDKRSYFRMYWAFLVDTQIILGTFCTDNYLNLLVIKLSFFVFTFQISFFLNAFFYSDEYISDAYHNDGVLDFFAGLPKSIYSFVATLITTNLLKMLSNSQSELKKVIREKGKYKNYVSIINIKLKKLRKKLIVYFILVFLLELFFLYYVTAFCAVYIHSQKYWFYGCLESFAMDSIVALIICIILSILRYISIKKQIKCFYTLANIIGTFL